MKELLVVLFVMVSLSAAASELNTGPALHGVTLQDADSMLRFIYEMKLDSPRYTYAVNQYRAISDRASYTVYVYINQENLPSILKYGLYKRIGASGLFASPVRISPDSRQLFGRVVLAFAVDQVMIQLPDNNGLGVALSPATGAASMPDLRIFKSLDVNNETDLMSDRFARGELGHLPPDRILIDESVRATASEHIRLDRALHEQIHPDQNSLIGEMQWDQAVMITKGVFMNALQANKFRLSTCAGLLAYTVQASER